MQGSAGVGSFRGSLQVTQLLGAKVHSPCAARPARKELGVFERNPEPAMEFNAIRYTIARKTRGAVYRVPDYQ